MKKSHSEGSELRVPALQNPPPSPPGLLSSYALPVEP